MKGLEKLFIRQLREIYDAEHLLVSALAEVAFYANSAILKFAVRQHKSQTEKHVYRLEEVFRELGHAPDRKRCPGIEGIIDDAQIKVMQFQHNSAQDAALISAAQKAEHYEITTYGTLCSWAKTLGYDEALSLLKHNLKEEISADRKLSFAAELLSNPKAERHATPSRPPDKAEFLKTITHAG